MFKWFLFILFLTAAAAVRAETMPMPEFMAIPQVNKAAPGGPYTTGGYVVFKYQCPPCPADALCKPCMDKNVIISEKNAVRKDYNDLGEGELVVFTDKTDELEIGKKYFFVVSSEPIEADPRPLRVNAIQWWEAP